MLGDRKVGGILCEAHWQSGTPGWIVVGIGLNVANAIPQELVGSATSLGEFVPGLRPDVLISPITKELRALSAGTGGLSAEELLAFRGRDWLLGRELLEPEPGRASGINPDGTLRVTRADGTIAAQRVGHVVLASG
jgi:biotin-(acetyl-CoA carboxylase) ligase